MYDLHPLTIAQYPPLDKRKCLLVTKHNPTINADGGSISPLIKYRPTKVIY